MEHLESTSRPLMSINEAKMLLEDEYSCFELVKERQVLLLSPRYMNDIHKGLLEVLKMQLGIYMEQFQGVPVAYTTIQREQEHAVTVSDQPHLHLSVQTELILFKPQPGQKVRAVINKLGRDYIGCLVHNYFNASVLEPEAGASQEIDWSNLQLSDSVVLSISEVYPQNKGLSLLCQLVSVESSEEMHEEESEKFYEFPTSSNSFDEDLKDEALASSQSVEITEVTPVKKKKKKRKSTQEESDIPTMSLESTLSVETIGEVISPKKKQKRKSFKVEMNSQDNNTLASSQSVEIIDEMTPTAKKKKKRKSFKVEPGELDTPTSAKKGRKRQHSDTNDSGIADPGTDLSDSLTSTPCENGLRKSKKRKLLSSAGYSLNDSYDLNSSQASSQDIKVCRESKKRKIQTE
ncbi:hypothetical protein CAPTEDRAFT_197917 [Capitella teleta]|uniref:DNA-directed RNA polymerase I subunit RPA43 n=1 Tax=Capitella teleta TaxID=283909 RepID=R7UE26_CAPTE|nr:hypothetical protein CAPTEDRAFT_197917 [Capitella teleta]|eukprot:ELU01502.1 hypothetical protein CAPTEDRAFT_197917 [Capitella teleta]